MKIHDIFFDQRLGKSLNIFFIFPSQCMHRNNFLQDVA